MVASLDLAYLVVDISQTELDKADERYSKVCADVADPHAFTDLRRHHHAYDLVFSRVVAEHILDPYTFHSNARLLLRSGGQAAHFFPTLYWPTFVFNRLTPQELSARVLSRLQPGREATGARGKFPAYYRWCRGPSRRQVERLRSTGFEVEEWTAYFGQPDYVEKVPLLRGLDAALTRALVQHPIRSLTSYARVLLIAR